MAKIIITKDNSIEQFKDGFNSLSSGVGDLTLLLDSDIITTINRLDSQAAIDGNALTLGGESPGYYLAWANITSKPTTAGIPENSGYKYYTKVRVDSDIGLKVNKVFVDALNINATQLQGRSDSYVRNFLNHTNTTDAITSAMLKNDAVTLPKLANPVPATGKRFMAWSGSAWITMDLTAIQGPTYLNFENGATADQTAGEIDSAYKSLNPQVTPAQITAGTDSATKRWAPANVKSAIIQHGLRSLPVNNYAGETGGFTVNAGQYNTRFLCSPSSSFTVTLPSSGTPPPVGTLLGFIDFNGTFDVNPVTLAHNGLKIFGVVDNLVLDKSRISIVLEYTGTSQGWVII